MSHESIQTSPADQVGLTPEQLETAVRLRNDVRETTAALNEQEAHRGDYSQERERERIRGNNPHPLDVAGTLRLDETAQGVVNVVNHAVKQHAANKADRAAAKHYGKNKAAYQEQALLDATEAGVKIEGRTIEGPTTNGYPDLGKFRTVPDPENWRGKSRMEKFRAAFAAEFAGLVGRNDRKYQLDANRDAAFVQGVAERAAKIDEERYAKEQAAQAQSSQPPASSGEAPK